MECSLSDSAESWSCKISLRIGYDSNGNLRGDEQVTPFGATFTDRSQFEITLRRAQAAILNPHLLAETFLDKSRLELKTVLDDPKALKFSKNTVVVEIADPEATSLSFVDLPGTLISLQPTLDANGIVIVIGLIQNETQDIIDTVRHLVEDHIARPETLILITIPMSGKSFPAYHFPPRCLGPDISCR